jgi:hypothetical protein
MPKPSMTTSNLALPIVCPHCQERVWLHAMLSAFEPPSVMEQIREAEEDDVLVEEETTVVGPPPVGFQDQACWRPTLPRAGERSRYSGSPAPLPESTSDDQQMQQRMYSRSPAPKQQWRAPPHPLQQQRLQQQLPANAQDDAVGQPKEEEGGGTGIVTNQKAAGQIAKPKEVMEPGVAKQKKAGPGAEQKALGQGTQRMASPSPTAKPDQGVASQASVPALVDHTAFATARAESMVPKPMEKKKPVGQGAEPKAAGRQTLESSDTVTDQEAVGQPKGIGIAKSTDQEAVGTFTERTMHAVGLGAMPKAVGRQTLESADTVTDQEAVGQPKGIGIATDQKLAAGQIAKLKGMEPGGTKQKATGTGDKQKAVGQSIQRMTSCSPTAKSSPGVAGQASSSASSGPTPAESVAMVGGSKARGRSLTPAVAVRHHATSPSSTSRDRSQKEELLRWPVLLPGAPSNFTREFWALVSDDRFIPVHMGVTWEGPTYSDYAFALVTHMQLGQMSNWVGETNVMPRVSRK